MRRHAAAFRDGGEMNHERRTQRTPFARSESFVLSGDINAVPPEQLSAVRTNVKFILFRRLWCMPRMLATCVGMPALHVRRTNSPRVAVPRTRATAVVWQNAADRCVRASANVVVWRYHDELQWEGRNAALRSHRPFSAQRSIARFTESQCSAKQRTESAAA